MRGTPSGTVFGVFPQWDHPRVCGEHNVCDVLGGHCEGSSPRMRGTLAGRGDEHPLTGIIPAYAGNTHNAPCACRRDRDHPRVCGEHIRGGGLRRHHSGSSPRMRGTHRFLEIFSKPCGIIPAYAGNTTHKYDFPFYQGDHPRVCGEHTPLDAKKIAHDRDHPRVCGEHANRTCWLRLLQGSSPRMRGTHAHEWGVRQFGGIIPAYAGNTSV